MKTAIPDQTHKKFFYGYVIVIAGFAVWFFGFGLAANSFGIFFKPLVDNFGWSRADTALAQSLNMMVGAGVTVIMGWLTDKLGPRLVVSIFGPLLGVSYLLMAHVSQLWQFHLNYAILAGIGGSVLTVPVMATVNRWFLRRRGLMSGILQSGSVGSTFFAPFTAYLILSQGWQNAYTILGSVLLLGILIPGLFLVRDPRDIGQLPDGDIEPSQPGVKKTRPAVTGLSLKQAVRTSQFWVVSGLFFSFGFCRDAFIAHTAPHVQDLGFTLTDAGVVLAVLSAFSFVGRLGMGRLSDVIGGKKALMLSEISTTLALILGLMMHSLGGLYIYAAVFGFGWGAQAVNRFTVSADAFGLASAGLIMGVLRIAESLAGAFGTWYAGRVFDAVGNYQPVFWVGLVISLLSISIAPMLSFVQSQKKKAAAAPSP